MAYDVAINNALLPSGRRGSICISEGRIAAITPTSSSARREIEAAGRLALPGLIDAHVHFRDPGNPQKEGFENGSLAALAGGVTTVMIMPTDNPMTADVETFRLKIELGDRSHVDFAIQAIVGAGTGICPALAEIGCCGFEIFLGDVPEPFLVSDYDTLCAVLAAVRGTGRRAGITPMLQRMVEPLTARLMSEEKNTPADFAASRPAEAEAAGVEMACKAALATGCPVHIRQVSSRAAVDVLRRYRSAEAGLISAETLPHNLLLSRDALERQGPFAKMSPPLRSDDDIASLWQAVHEGLIDIVVTDHAPHLPAEKMQGMHNIWKAPSGVPGLETMLPLLLECWAAGRLTLDDIVAWTSVNPASLFGLDHRKGGLKPGADADILLIDTDHTYRIEGQKQVTRAGSTPFEGMTGRGRIDLAFLRGNIVWEDRRPTGPQGEFVPARPVT